MDNTITTSRSVAFTAIKASQKTLKPASIDLAAQGFSVDSAKVATVANVAKPSEARRIEGARDVGTREAAARRIDNAREVATRRLEAAQTPEVSVLYADRSVARIRPEATEGTPTVRVDTSFIEKAFNAADAAGNGDGSLTLDEFNNALKNQFAAIQGDAKLTSEEKDAAIQQFIFNQYHASNLFNAFSKDGVLDQEGLGKIKQLAQSFLGGVDTIA